jgi:F420-0:gamma-glutamyl ligase
LKSSRRWNSFEKFRRPAGFVPEIVNLRHFLYPYGMKFIPLKTRAILPPRDDIYAILDESTPTLRDGDILFITSKVLAIHQGRCVKIDPNKPGAKGLKTKLIKREADRYAHSHLKTWKDLYLTIKDHTLIANAGIDESNANGYYILWPRRPSALAKEIRSYLIKKFRIKNFAVVITDSHIVPLRHGTLGISIGFYGMEPLHGYRGTPDIFGRLLKHTSKNIVDALSTMAVLLMGEGNERTPLLLLRDAKFVTFTDKPTYRKSVVAPHNDLYSPFWRAFK